MVEQVQQNVLGCKNEANNMAETDQRRPKRQLDITVNLWKTPIAYRFEPEELLGNYGNYLNKNIISNYIKFLRFRLKIDFSENQFYC